MGTIIIDPMIEINSLLNISEDDLFEDFEDGRLISFTFNWIGNWEGIDRAYDTGTGTIREYRPPGHNM